MAGGGYGKGSGVPLSERRRTDQHEPTAPAERPACPARHVWVAAPVDGPQPRAGLLLEWRQVGHRWEGLVTYPAELRPGVWSTVTEWVPAELLAPA